MQHDSSNNSPFQFVESVISELKLNNQILNLTNSDTLFSLDSIDFITSITEKDDLFFGELTLSVKASAIQNNANMSISLTEKGFFTQSRQSGTRDVFENLLEFNGTSILYSIARSIIISITSQAVSNGQMRLPVVNMTQAVQAIKNQRQ